MMYSFSVAEQFVVFLQAFGFGFIVGLLHGLTDFLFGLFSRKKSTVAGDVVFCIIFALMLFCFVLAYNLGKLRLYLIMGLCFGVAVYSLSVGDIVSGSLFRVKKIIHRCFWRFATIVGFNKTTEKNKRTSEKNK